MLFRHRQTLVNKEMGDGGDLVNDGNGSSRAQPCSDCKPCCIRFLASKYKFDWVQEYGFRICISLTEKKGNCVGCQDDLLQITSASQSKIVWQVKKKWALVYHRYLSMNQ